MFAFVARKIPVPWPKFWAWLPLVSLPGVAVGIGADWPAWAFMWLLAFSIYAGLKWLSFADAVDLSRSTLGRSFGYLLLWPGMDAKSFLATDQTVARPSLQEWFSAFGKVAFGAMLIFAGASLVHQHPFAAGWIGMAGIAFTLHFGLFHVLAVGWRRAGVEAAPLMEAPVLASSLSDFWGRRWNLAFRDLAHAYVFRPVVGRLGVAGATMAVFLVSGLLHDAVISLPARGGFGLPTLYFVLQGLGVLCERSRLGKRIGARKGVTGRVFCAAVTVGPLGLLFHRPFVERVVAPMLSALPGLGG